MYRPQFVYAVASSPCEDQRCTYSFDSVNIPTFTGTLAPGQQSGRIPLRLDKDADFFLRGLSQQGRVSIRLEDSKGNALSDSENRLQAQNFMLAVEYGLTGGAGFVALESGPEGVRMPAGGNFALYIFNPSNATINLSDCVVNLHGIKRYPGGLCEN